MSASPGGEQSETSKWFTQSSIRDEQVVHSEFNPRRASGSLRVQSETSKWFTQSSIRDEQVVHSDFDVASAEASVVTRTLSPTLAADPSCCLSGTGSEM